MSTNGSGNIIHVRPDIAAEIAEGKPVVALESTVITHGLAHPANLETALSMEQAVREAGALPATIGLIEGKIHVGLDESQLEYLAGLPADKVQKCSRRDLAVVLANKGNGGTTVAGTMIIAHQVGIKVFATGGIGGVHRGHPFDVSADLEELSRTPVTVVCSGAKSILDLPATMEVLETKGVTLIGYQTDELPAFFARHSGLTVPARLDSPAEIARVVAAQEQLGLQSGIVVAVPVPGKDAYDANHAEALIAQATQEAEALEVKGAAATPWLLSRIAELSSGQSVEANVSLLRNNGSVAAQIAAALTDLRA